MATDNNELDIDFDYVPEKPQVIAYEWVLTQGKGEEIILSEPQFAAYKKQVEAGDMRQLFFGDVVVNPSFVMNLKKRQADVIKDKYPCKQCYSSGRIPDNSGWCPNCGGSGVNLPK